MASWCSVLAWLEHLVTYVTLGVLQLINQDTCSNIVIMLDWVFAATTPGSISVYSCADQVLNACRLTNENNLFCWFGLACRLGLAVIDCFIFFVVVFTVVGTPVGAFPSLETPLEALLLP